MVKNHGSPVIVHSSRRQSSRLFEMDKVNPLVPPWWWWLVPCLASSSGKIRAPITEYTMTRTTRPGVEKMHRIVRLQQRPRDVSDTPLQSSRWSCSICSASDISPHAFHQSPVTELWFPRCCRTLFWRLSVDAGRLIPSVFCLLPSSSRSRTSEQNFKPTTTLHGYHTVDQDDPEIEKCPIY